MRLLTAGVPLDTTRDVDGPAAKLSRVRPAAREQVAADALGNGSRRCRDLAEVGRSAAELLRRRARTGRTGCLRWPCSKAAGTLGWPDRVAAARRLPPPPVADVRAAALDLVLD